MTDLVISLIALIVNLNYSNSIVTLVEVLENVRNISYSQYVQIYI